MDYPIGLEPHLSRYIKFLDSRPIRNLEKEKGFEIHHKIPRGLGGDNSSANLIKLSIREHLIAHLILWKCYSGKMATAYYCMTLYENRGRAHLTSKQLAILRALANEKRFSLKDWYQTHPLTPEIREKISKGRKGKSLSPDAIKRMAETKRSRPLSEKQIAQLKRLHADSANVHAKASATRKRNISRL